MGAPRELDALRQMAAGQKPFEDCPPHSPIQATQVGGSHYTDMAIQPATYILANNLGWAEGDAIAYISRWRSKNGVEDLKKAQHMLQMLIESEEAKQMDGPRENPTDG